MSKFIFKSRDLTGRLVEGEQEAESAQLVAEQLGRRNLAVIEIRPKTQSLLNLDLAALPARWARVKQRDLAVFFRQLATIFSAGVPLFESLQAIEDQVSAENLKKIIHSLRLDVEAGLTFSQALGRHPKTFSGLVVTMVGAGEQGGVLADVLGRISSYLEKETQLQQKIQGALRYPLLVLASLLSAFLMAVTFIIPRFRSIFGAFKTELPWPTRLLLGVNFILVNYWWLLLIVSFGLYSGARFLLNTPAGRRQADGLALAVPVFGPLNTKISLSRLFRMLSAMINSGIPLVSALEVTANTSGNVIVAGIIKDIRDKIVGGSSLSLAMADYKLFPSSSVQMVSIGEKSGNLESMLVKSSDYFDEETDFTVSNLMSLLEPFMILFLALLVLLLALGIFLPMWGMLRLYS